VSIFLIIINLKKLYNGSELAIMIDIIYHDFIIGKACYMLTRADRKSVN
jgi:hypothetical protein